MEVRGSRMSRGLGRLINFSGSREGIFLSMACPIAADFPAHSRESLFRLAARPRLCSSLTVSPVCPRTRPSKKPDIRPMGVYSAARGIAFASSGQRLVSFVVIAVLEFLNCNRICLNRF